MVLGRYVVDVTLVILRRCGRVFKFRRVPFAAYPSAEANLLPLSWPTLVHEVCWRFKLRYLSIQLIGGIVEIKIRSVLS
jgi:hypothetical protein